MLIPKRKKIDLALEILEEAIDEYRGYIASYPGDQNAEPDGGWNICIEDLSEVVTWIKCRECVVNDGYNCDGEIEMRSLYNNQLEVPTCLAHYESMQKIRIGIDIEV